MHLSLSFDKIADSNSAYLLSSYNTRMMICKILAALNEILPLLNKVYSIEKNTHQVGRGLF